MNGVLNLIGQWTEYLDTGALEGDFSISGALDVAGDLLCESSVHVDTDLVVDGTISGTYVHGTKTLLLGPQGFQPLSGTTAAYFLTATQGINIACSVPIEAGKRITAVRAEIQDVAGTSMGITLTRVDAYASGAVVGSSGSSSGAGTQQTISITGLTEVTVAGSSYVITASRSFGVGTDLNVVRVEVDFDQLS